MKTPNEIKSWIDMLLSRRPNTEDRNYLEAIKCYMDKVERPRGEWIKGREISRTMIGNNIEHIDYKDYTCSNCGLVLDYLLYNQDGSAFYKFCPNCGADMRKETDND